VQWAIILVAAGASTRMGFSKLWTEVCGLPLLGYALRAALAAEPDELVLVVSEDRLSEAQSLADRTATARSSPPATAGPLAGALAPLARVGASSSPLARVAAGGARRRDSVSAGVAATRAEWLAIHDAARALAPADVFARGLGAAQATGAAIPVVQLKDTIKRVADSRLIGTPLRSEHAAVQTPQVFRRDILERALALSDQDVTDEAALVEQLGIPVATFEGDERAFKVTTPLDFQLVSAMLRP
jgi:2-C-methyl-D-erythritol 4-phosphate cytidylyltransferase